MFKKKFLGVLLGIISVVLLPSVALAQTTNDDTTYEDTSLDWEYDWDWDDYEDTDSYYDLDKENLTELAGLGKAFAGITVVWGIFSAVFGIAMYIYMGITYMKIAKKLNHPNAWFAWIPILNIVLHFQLAQMSGWFVLLMLIPLANIIVYVIATMKICERRGYNKLLGLLMLVPLANFILFGILAWKKDSSKTTSNPIVKEEVNVEEVIKKKDETVKKETVE